MCAQLLSHVQLFVTLWTTAGRVFYRWDSPGRNTEVGCHFLLQRIFPDPEIESMSPASPALEECSLPLCHLKSPQMAKGHMKRCSTLATIRQMQIKTIIRYHLIPVRMAIFDKSTSNKFWRGCGERGTLLVCQWKSKLVQPLWRIGWKFLKKLNIVLPYDLAIPFLGIYLEKMII